MAATEGREGVRMRGRGFYLGRQVALDAEGHDGVDNIVVVLLERLDGLLPGYVGLGHDELNILVLDALGVHLLAVILLLLSSLLGGIATLDGLAGLAVVVARVVVLSGSQLLSSGGLGGGVQVLDLGLTEDAASSSCQTM